MTTTSALADPIKFAARPVLQTVFAHLQPQKLTLEHWLSRLEAAQSEIERQTDPLSFRVFRLYLAGSAYEFHRGRLNIYQTLLAKPVRGQSGLPLTRGLVSNIGESRSIDGLEQDWIEGAGALSRAATSASQVSSCFFSNDVAPVRPVRQPTRRVASKVRNCRWTSRLGRDCIAGLGPRQAKSHRRSRKGSD